MWNVTRKSKGQKKSKKEGMNTNKSKHRRDLFLFVWKEMRNETKIDYGVDEMKMDKLSKQTLMRRQRRTRELKVTTKIVTCGQWECGPKSGNKNRKQII
jgi:hypothetical protein